MSKRIGLLQRIQSSLSARISLWTVLFAALVFSTALLVLGVRSRRTVREEAFKTASQVLDNTVYRVNDILESVELVADNMEWLIYKNLDNPDAMLEISHNVVQGNSFLNGCSISFEPYFYPQKGRYFSAYSNNNGRYVYTTQEGEDDYQYFYLNWYMLPKLLQQPVWTEPYSDQEIADEGKMSLEMTVSYCKPLIGNDGIFIGVLSLDVSLKWFSDMISDVKPYKDSYAFLIGRGGTYLVHPDPDKLFYETLFTPALVGEAPPEQIQLGKDMLDWKEGAYQFKEKGKAASYVFFKPLMHTGWSIAIVCPVYSIFGGFNRLRNVMLLNILIGLLLQFLVLYKVISKLLRPLKHLAGHAETIASGNFDITLPPMDRTDEIGVLNRSFRYMQSSLITYIDELTQSTAKRERIEGELQIARDIQMGMVPRVFPAFPERRDIDMYADMFPAKEVGGDLYDYFIQDEKLYFCIGDVSGKGVPASLFMAVARNLFRVVAGQGMTPEEVARQINDTISRDNQQMMFITLFIGLIDLRSGSFHFCNCGHNPPIVLSRSGAAPHFLDCHPNVPVGVAQGFVFQGQCLENFRDTPLLMYTDGLTEAEDADHQLLGEDRVMEALSATPYTNAANTVLLLLDTVHAHVKDAEQSDDLTLLCINTL